MSLLGRSIFVACCFSLVTYFKLIIFHNFHAQDVVISTLKITSEFRHIISYTVWKESYFLGELFVWEELMPILRCRQAHAVTRPINRLRRNFDWWLIVVTSCAISVLLHSNGMKGFAQSRKPLVMELARLSVWNLSHWATFLPLIVCVYLLSHFRGELKNHMIGIAECVKSLQGHPRSMIFVSIEWAYATSYQWSVVTLIISHRFWDTTTYWLENTNFSYPTCVLSQMWGYSPCTRSLSRVREELRHWAN